MVYETQTLSLLVLLVGATLVLSIIIRALMERTHIPPLIGFMLLGFLIRAADEYLGFLGKGALGVFEFLSAIGVVALLFRIGLESNLPGLIHQLPRAGIIWIGNILLSGIPGYLAGRYLLGFELLPSLFTAVALTATSVGVSMKVWQERDALKSENGELLVDVAELDDISGVAFMAILFAIIPVLHGDGNGPILSQMFSTAGIFLLKLALFTGFCILFSKYAERYLTRAFIDIGKRQEPMLLVAGVGIVIAAIAGWLGFSLAIGALFAGLVFSRDPNAVKQDASFGAVYELFTPFFFIGIGLRMAPDALGASVIPAVILIAVAIVGKIAGAALPALLETSIAGAILLGISMVPRAEIAMIVMERGHQLGPEAVPPKLFAGMVVVSAITCLTAPLVLDRLLRKWPQKA